MAANNLIQVKRTSVPGRAPNTSILSTGELALNMADGILYSSNGSAIFEIGANNTNVTISGNLSVNAILANGSYGTYGQVLLSNSDGTYWHTHFTPSDFPPPDPILGDIWYSTVFDKPYMYVFDGTSSYWYDFLPF
jgi:hypothetical protein